MPEFNGRKQIIINLMRKQQNDLTEENLNYIAELTNGYSGADMTNLCREAGVNFNFNFKKEKITFLNITLNFKKALGPIRSLEISSIATISVDQVIIKILRIKIPIIIFKKHFFLNFKG